MIMKRCIAVFLAALICAGLAGCGSKTDKEAPTSPAESSIPESSAEIQESSKTTSDEQSENKENDKFTSGIGIVDRDGKHIGNIQEHCGITLTDSGIFYITAQNDGADPDAVGMMEGEKTTYSYHLYDTQTNKNYPFGTVPEQDYEAGYVRTELNGKLYTIIITGDILDREPDSMMLLEFDLKKHTIDQYKISDNGFPYTAMTEADGKLLILNHDQTDVLHDRLYLFDPDSKESKEVLHFELSGNTGDTLRSVYSDDKNIYLLRLRFEGESNVKMFLDTYDLSFKKLSEKDITSVIKAAAGVDLAPDDTINEMKQMVGKFMVLDEKYVYYENFSATRFLCNPEDGKLFDETLGFGDLFIASTGSGKPFFCYIYGGSKNENAVFDWKNGSLEKTLFKADDDRYYITAASSSPNGKRLIQVSYTNPGNSSDTLPTKIYYF